MRLLKIKIVFFLAVALLTSCLRNLDFNQIDDLEFKPVFESSLIYFTVQQTDFIVNGFEITQVSDVTRFTVFESQGFKDNLVKAEIDFKIDNRFNRGFVIDFDFLDVNDNVVYSFSPLSISANQRNFTQTQTVIVSSNPAFLSSEKMKITIHLLPSVTPLDPDVDMSFEFKTSGKFYISF